ncbi:phospholipid carrier-dependent glycosyltransferase [Ruminococcus sp. HUN007]|uniref:phospholipid carrier-dependent glycosyltransferase n=1 Tax=Ruminococcus sp. HUN007 TaxID=1514668 RepID=UPI0005D21A02|nr:phospholipid carrier-dependent glycosyltransferase [Ruminococcus sp. HUN007]
MTSVFIYTIISCALFWCIYSYRDRHNMIKGYSPAELVPFYVLMRLVPLFMMQERGTSNYVACILDAVVLAAVCFAASGMTRSKSIAAALYIFSPLPVICIAVGGTKMIIANIAVTAAALVVTGIMSSKYPLSSPSSFMRSYVTICTGIHFGGYSLFAQRHSFSELYNKHYFPTFLVAGLLLITAGLVMLFPAIRNYGKQGSTSGNGEDVPAISSEAPEKFGKKNFIHIIILTALYAAVVFFQLGSHTSPETSRKFNSNDPDNSEIIIDLGEYKNVSGLQIFLGPESLRKISVSAYDEVEREWKVIKEGEELKTAFAWNRVDFSWSVRYIGIVFSHEDTHFNEVIVLGSDDSVITPVNTSAYPELFDEQDEFPGTEASYYYRMMFDEIYHGRTGYEFIHNLPIYENTHPPLGKTLIGLGIRAFGMNPFGWRFTVAVFGTLMVPLMYLFAWKISHRSGSALTGGVLLATESMHLTLSRIATIDIIVAQFIVMMFFFMYCFVDEMLRGGKLSKQILWIFLCGVSTALAIATKWTGLYAAAGIAVIFFTFLIKHCAEKKTLKESMPYLLKLFVVCVISFIVIPSVTYVLSYIEFAQVYTDKDIIHHAIENSKSMYSYHSNVTDSHPYQSEWYEWITDKKPLLDAINSFDGDRVSSVATFMNPFIAFAGLAAFFHNVFLWRTRKSMAAQYLSISYIAMLMPWLFIHRTVFIYQYFGCLLIMILLICNSLRSMKGSARKREIITMAVSAAVFFMFLPESTGIAVPRTYIKHVLELVPTWIFE